MDLLSKNELLKSFLDIREHYRSDTEVGENIRQGINDCIDKIENSSSTEFISLKHLGHSDLSHLQRQVQNKIEELTGEPEVDIFVISGLYDFRYTKCHEKAKRILQESLNELLTEIEEDFADFKIDIKIKSIKESDLKNYKIE